MNRVFSVGSRVRLADGRSGILVLDNEDGTWNTEFEDGGEADLPASWFGLHDEQVDWREEQRRDDCNESSSGLRCRRPSGIGATPIQGGLGLFDDGAELDADDSDDEAYTAKAAAADAELDVEPVGSYKRSCLRAALMLLLVSGTGGVGFVTAALKAYDWLRPLVTVVNPGDVRETERIFFGGEPWLVSCVTTQSVKKAPPKVLVEAAEILRPHGMRVARVHCWEPVETRHGPQTLASRFGFRNKPPVVMSTLGKGRPQFLVSSGVGPQQLASSALDAVTRAARPEWSEKVGARPHGRRERVGKRPADENAVGSEAGFEASDDEREEEVSLE
jgi:hypothetical protein